MTSASGGPRRDPPDRRPSQGVDAVLQPFVDVAISDLVERLQVAADEVTVISAAFVTWPDRALGCPRPGMIYQQVTVDGTLIVLGAGGRSYRYHSGGSRAPFLCEAVFRATPVTPV